MIYIIMANFTVLQPLTISRGRASHKVSSLKKLAVHKVPYLIISIKNYVDEKKLAKMNRQKLCEVRRFTSMVETRSGQPAA